MKRVLAIRGGAIGDFVLTLPALKLIRDGFPDARLEILGYKHIVALAENRHYADATRSIESAGFASFFAKDAQLPAKLRDYFGSFDLIVSYLFDPDGIFQANVGRCGRGDFLACSPKITGAEHAAIQLAQPLKQIGLRLTDHAAKLYPADADRYHAQNYPDASLIALHPGSGSARKNWPLERWIALLERVLAISSEICALIVGGEADTSQLAALRIAFSGARVRYAENLSLVHLAAVIQRSRLFIGHDSGISHIAAAVGTPSILLFGTTDPSIWAPANAKTRVIQSRTGQMRDISVEEVCAAIVGTETIPRATN